MSTRTYSIAFVVILLCLAAPLAYGLWQHNPSAPSLTSSTATPTPTPRTRFHLLIVPGHDTASGGTSYRDLYERDVAVELADAIAQELSSDPTIDVMIARDTTSWHPLLAEYFRSHEQEILSFKTEHQKIERALLASGGKKYIPDIATHSNVDTKTAIELYGINKWANEHDIDMILHIHFNNTVRPNQNVPGTSHGFTLYIPESQLPNSRASRVIAEPMFASLKKIMSPEVNTIVEDQSLIALGAAATLTKPSILIEYAYIYEKSLQSLDTRTAFLHTLAQQTAAGIVLYLDHEVR